jgi:hypothetical protein
MKIGIGIGSSEGQNFAPLLELDYPHLASPRAALLMITSLAGQSFFDLYTAAKNYPYTLLGLSGPPFVTSNGLSSLCWLGSLFRGGSRVDDSHHVSSSGGPA